MVLNDTEWYSMVISGIPLALFCKGRFSKVAQPGDVYSGEHGDGLNRRTVIRTGFIISFGLSVFQNEKQVKIRYF